MQETWVWSQAATWHWAEFPELSSRPLLVLRVKHSSMSMSIPDSLTIPSPILPSGDHQVITECWAEFPVLCSRSLLVLLVKSSHASMSIPDSLTVPSPILPACSHKLVFYVYESLCVLYITSLVFFFRFCVSGIIWFLFICLTYFTLSIHVAANGIMSFFFMAK